MRRIILLAVGAVVLIVISGFTGAQIGKNYILEATATKSLRAPQESNSLINPLLLCDNSAGKPINELGELEKKITDFASDKQFEGVSGFSVYFRDFSNGQWVGINPNVNYDPASMLKLPLLIAYLKEAEEDPALLSKKLVYPGEPGNDGRKFYTLVANQSYTIQTLLDKMIIESDNAAKDLLFASMDLKIVNEIFSDLGVEVIDFDSTYKISAKNYSLFFRILYNATYLNREMSQKALDMLTRAEFKNGITGGIPAGTRVAHKFGQYNSNPAVPWELHDCGIVYRPGHPYLLCVMTQGADLPVLEKLIQGISGLAYQSTAQ